MGETPAQGAPMHLEVEGYSQSTVQGVSKGIPSDQDQINAHTFDPFDWRVTFDPFDWRVTFDSQV